MGFKVDDTGQKKYGQLIDQTKTKQQSLTASFLKAGAIMGAAKFVIGGAFSFIRDSVIGATAETERYRVALGTMMGDQEKANKIIHDLDYSPVSDFYGTAAAIGGLQSMVTFGMQAEEAADILTRVGDIAQGSGEAFQSMSANLGQVFTKGKADAMDLKQFAAQGFDVVGEVAKASGKSREEIQKAGVTYAQTKAALEALTNEGGKYNGMLAKQANTLGGIIKQFASLKAATAEAIGTGVSDELKDMLKYLLEIARAGQDTFVGIFVKVIKEVIHWIMQIQIMFEVLGYRIADMGDMLSPVKQLFKDLKTVAGDVLTGIMNWVVRVAPVFLQAFNTIYAFVGPILRQIGELVKSLLDFSASGFEGLKPILTALKVPFTVIGNVVGAIVKGLAVLIDVLSPISGIVTFIVAAIAAWTAAQWLLNIALNANPIGLIVLAILAVIGAIALLIKNWETVVNFFKGIGETIASFFVNMWKKIVGFFKKYGELILQILAIMIFGIPGLIAVAVRQIIKHWDVIWPAIKKVLDKVISFIVAFGKKIAQIFWSVVESIKSIFNTIVDWFSKLWEIIVSVAINVWNTLKDWFSGLVEGIKGIWQGITTFFKGLWEAVQEGPTAAIEYIKNAFFGLFNTIQEKLFGFINKIKEAWEGVKGFFGGIADGVVNFVTGGKPGGKQLQPAYATATQSATASRVGPTSNYAYNNAGSNTTVNAPTTMNVTVPQGTTQAQSEAIARQVNAQFDLKLAGSINSSRADIPTPEIRRH